MTAQILPFDPTAIPAAIPAGTQTLLPPHVRDRWSTAGPAHLVLGHDAALLVSARPHTAYLKIVDAAGSAPAIAALVEALAAKARADGLVQLKWQGTPPTPVAGFTPLTPPLPSGPGTDVPSTGAVRWLVPDVTVRPAPYYAQTTHYSCGAVSALTAVGVLTLTPGLNAAREMAFWEEATNHPACEPVGLGVALARRHPDLDVTIALDIDRPVVLEHLEQAEQDWRAALQVASRTEAAGLGVPVSPERLSVTELIEAARAGTEALMLISLELMRSFAVPHWVRCCGTAGGAVVIDDPSVDPARGESWVDGHLLPVRGEEFDRMAAYGPEGYRGAVLLRSRAETTS